MTHRFECVSAKPMTVEQARRALHFMADFWFPRMDRVAAGRRARARFEAEQDAAEAAHNARCAQLRSIAALPDDDLQWLLDIGWRPEW